MDHTPINYNPYAHIMLVDWRGLCMNVATGTFLGKHSGVPLSLILVSCLRTRCRVRRCNQGRTIFSETRTVAMTLPVGLPGANWRAAVSAIFARRKPAAQVSRADGQSPVRLTIATDKIH